MTAVAILPGAIFRGVVLSLVIMASAAGQSTFQLLITQGNNASTVQNGATVAFNSAIGQAEIATVIATYTGSGKITIIQQPQVFGSVAFTSSITAALPLTLTS